MKQFQSTEQSRSPPPISALQRLRSYRTVEDEEEIEER
jgi:hypothetical protein